MLKKVENYRSMSKKKIKQSIVNKSGIITNYEIFKKLLEQIFKIQLLNSDIWAKAYYWFEELANKTKFEKHQ